MRLTLIAALASVSMLAGCGRAPEKAEAPAPEAAAPQEQAQAPAATDPTVAVDTAAGGVSPQIADMIDCAGAYGAVGKIDPTSPEQNLQAPWVQEFSGIQMSIMTAPGSPGADAMSSQTMASVAQWKGQPEAAQLARAEACKAQYR